MNRKTIQTNYLAHHGVLGMKWGVRKQKASNGGSSSTNKPNAKTPEQKALQRQKRINTAKKVAYYTTVTAGLGLMAARSISLQKKGSSKVYKTMNKNVNLDKLINSSGPNVVKKQSISKSLKLKDLTMDDLKKLDLY